MEYIFILCSNDPERKEYINQLVKDFNELVYKKYPDCVILEGNIKVRFFTDIECKMGKTLGYRPFCTLDYYDKKELVKRLQEIIEGKIKKLEVNQND